MLNGRVLVQIGTYNANLQGNKGLPQNLVDWLAPSLEVSNFLANTRTAPDIIAIGFQELLPLHLGWTEGLWVSAIAHQLAYNTLEALTAPRLLSLGDIAVTGLSRPVVRSRDALIRSQIEAHAPNNESYALIAKVVNVCGALLVYAREDTVKPRVRDVQTQWAACGPGWMGNKGAVAVRFRIDDEVYTFLNAHLTAHSPNYERRTQDWANIISSTLFPPLPESKGKAYSTIYDSTHLFFFGDLNFRLDVPKSLNRSEMERMVRTVEGRKQLIQYDQLVRAQREGRIPPMKEAALWDFQPTYKFLLKHVDKYSEQRLPAWTDRILYTSASDQSTMQSSIETLLYTSIPSYTTSDHKPVMALLLIPSPISAQLPSSEAGPADSTTSLLLSSCIRTILHPGAKYAPDPRWRLKRWTGKILGWLIGWPWCFITLLGAGNAVAGVINFFLGCMVIYWWNRVGS